MFENGFPREWSTIKKLAILFRAVVNAIAPVLKTVTGAIIHITDALAKPVQALSIALEPIQNLNGYDNPWPAGGGKNLFNADVYPTTTTSGVTCTNNGDGSFTLNGTATTDVYFGVFDAMFANDNLPSATYRLTGGVAGGGADTYQLYVRPSYIADNNGKGKTFTGTVVGGSIFVKSGYTCSNLVFWPMIRLASNGDDTFAPYSNICPISGWTECKVYVSPTQNAQDATVYTVDLDGTRYGGTLDVLAGKLTVTDGYIASYNGETLPSTWISDRDVYAAGTTPTTGAEVVYKLASPFEIDLTETEVELLTGTNNIWSDTGDVTVTIGNEIPTPYPLGGAIFPSVSNGDVLVFDGIDGKITKNGANAAASVNWTEFPQLVPGENTIPCPDDVTVEYYPTYI